MRTIFTFIKRRLMRFWKDERGNASIEHAIWIPFLFFFFTLAPDFLNLGAVYLSGHNVAEKTMQLMEMHGGMNDVVAKDMVTFMQAAKLTPEQWQVITNSYLVPYGEPLELTMQTRVPLKAFRWFGMDIQVPIEITKIGISQQAGPLM